MADPSDQGTAPDTGAGETRMRRAADRVGGFLLVAGILLVW